MKYLNKKVIIFSILGMAVLSLLLFLAPWAMNRPVKNNDGSIKVKDSYLTKEQTISSPVEKPDVSQFFSSTIEENGKKYNLLDTKTEKIGQEYSEPYVYEVVEELSDNDFAQEELTVPVDGHGNVKVKLIQKEKIGEVERDSIRVEHFQDYKNVFNKPNVPSTKTIDYYDNETKQTYKAQVSLESLKTIESPHWVNDLSLPLTFHTYDAGYYELYGQRILHNDNIPDLYGKEKQILKLLGLNSNYYRLTSFSWNGDVYEVNGNKKRNAIAKGSRLLSSYRATYANNDFKLPATKSKTKLKYRSDENVTGDIIYKIKITSVYRTVISAIAFAPAVISTAIFLALILWYLSQKKKDKAEGKNEI